MEEKVLSSLNGVGLYGVVSISIFFAFFAGMLLWATCLKKRYLNSMSDLPLESERVPAVRAENQPIEHDHEQ